MVNICHNDGTESNGYTNMVKHLSYNDGTDSNGYTNMVKHLSYNDGTDSNGYTNMVNISVIMMALTAFGIQ